MRKCVFAGYSRTATTLYPVQNHWCPLTESLDIVESNDIEQRSWWDCYYAQDDLKLYIAHILIDIISLDTGSFRLLFNVFYNQLYVHNNIISIFIKNL